MNGHRGYYEDGWEVVTLHRALTPFDDAEWELYDLTTDPVELRDRSGDEPERRQALIDAWEREAWANQIYPLDEGSQYKYVVRPERSRVYGEPVTIVAATPSLERWRSAQLIWFRSVTITAAVDFAPGDHGMLVAHGDQGGGYALYVLDDELTLRPQRRARPAAPLLRGNGGGRRPRDRGPPRRRRRRHLDRPPGRRRHRASVGSRGCPSSRAWPPSRGSMSASTGARR